MKNKIQLFQDRLVRCMWDDEEEIWWFSIVDVVTIFTGAKDNVTGRKYWNKLKQRLTAESNETVTNCHQLKLKAEDGKQRLTDVASTEQVLRIIQSIPSKKAEPFKLWLAKVGNDRLNEIEDPELAIDRAMINFRNLGYSKEWINARLQSIQFRKELTDEWQRTGVKEGLEYALLTNLMTKTWSGKTVKEYKRYKHLKKENLRDNMTSIELALNILAETSTTELSKSKNPKNIVENQDLALQGGSISKQARENLEAQTGKSVISPKNSLKVRLPSFRLKAKRIENQ